MGFLLILLFIPLSSSHLFTNIEIKGNKYFSTEKIIKSTNFCKSDNLTEEKIDECLREILQLYKNTGFFDAEIYYELQDNTLKLNISEGEQFRLNNIEIKGNRFIKDNVVLGLLGIGKNRIFKIDDFRRGIDEILDFYGNGGFPFTKIIPSYFTTEQNKIDIGIEIEEGPRLRWGGVFVQGNSITKNYIISKQLRIPKGDYFSENQLYTSRSWLDKLQYIEIEDDFQLVKGEESGTVSLLITVKEKKSNRFSGIIGYIPSREEEKGGYIGTVMTEMLNLFGTGRAIRIAWEKQIPPYTKLDVTYKEPWILGSQSSLVLNLLHFLEDTLYTFSKANLEVKTDVSLNISLNISAGWERFTPACIDLPAARKYSLGSAIEFSNLDYQINPRKGVDYIFFTEYGKKAATNVMKFTLDLLNVFPLFTNNAFAVLFSGKAIRTNHPPLPEYEQYTLGGYNNLRGYRERQFRTTQMLRVSPEYRYLVSRKSRLYLFYDCAFFKTSTYTTGITEDFFKYGYGVGAKFTSGIGIISMEYAIGEEKTFMKGKIHIGIDTLF